MSTPAPRAAAYDATTPDAALVDCALDWLGAGDPVTLVTVLETWGSAPRPAGSLLALRGSGTALAGSVSGGCVEDELLKLLDAGALNATRPRLLEIGADPGQASRLRLPCGGRMLLLVETLFSVRDLLPLQAAIAARRCVTRESGIDGEPPRLTPGSQGTDFAWDGRRARRVFGPTWRLLLIGAGELSAEVARLGLRLGYEVVVCEPREPYRGAWAVPGVPLDPRAPDDAARALADDPRSAVLALSHDPRVDDMALMQALDSRAFYVGALGSRRGQAARRERLAAVGVSRAGLARLHGPVGLPIGSRTPAEIAVAILAELVAQRRLGHTCVEARHCGETAP